MHELSILVPLLGRPHLIRPLLDDIAAVTVCDYEVVLLATHGDTPVAQELARVIMSNDHPIKVFSFPRKPIGDYAAKINDGYRLTESPHLFCGAIDLHFHPDWYEEAVRAIAPGIGVVGTQDLGNSRVLRGEHATHCLVTRDYADLGTIDEPRKVLHEGYWHEFVDNEQVETARFRGMFAFAPLSFVEHMHPSWKKAPLDDMYRKQRARMIYGRKIYNRRRHLWS